MYCVEEKDSVCHNTLKHMIYHEHYTILFYRKCVLLLIFPFFYFFMIDQTIRYILHEYLNFTQNTENISSNINNFFNINVLSFGSL